MQDQHVANWHVERRAAGAKVGRAVDSGEGIEMVAFVGNARRNALVDHVHRAADRLTAVQQHGGAAQDLDTLGCERIDRRRMVDRGVRNIRRSDPIDKHAHALALEAAQHRTR